MPVRALYLLADSGRGGAVSAERVSRREATLALARHSVASRLFDRDLLARHLEFCAQAAALIPVRRLSYPREYALLPRVREVIEADVGTCSGAMPGTQSPAPMRSPAANTPATL